MSSDQPQFPSLPSNRPAQIFTGKGVIERVITNLNKTWWDTAIDTGDLYAFTENVISHVVGTIDTVIRSNMALKKLTPEAVLEAITEMIKWADEHPEMLIYIPRDSEKYIRNRWIFS